MSGVAYAFLPITEEEGALRRRSRSGRGGESGERIKRIYWPRPCPAGHGDVRSAPATDDGTRRGPRRLAVHFTDGVRCRFSHAVVPGTGSGADRKFAELLEVRQ